ncbi:MAG TPA: hypothetical protein VK909_14040 [Anaerolineales bacterium]|nr:hypothetical protein [Anaerolineales bacterium]
MPVLRSADRIAIFIHFMEMLALEGLQQIANLFFRVKCLSGAFAHESRAQNLSAE